jgi:Ca-activated chloride channel family protein
MSTPFELRAYAEHKNVEPGTSTLWAAIRVDPKGKALEADRAPLAIALVIDTSGSMQGDPIAHVIKSCEIVAELLDARDQLAIVTFSDHAGIRCGLTTTDPAGRQQIRAAISGVTAGGSTNMHGGIGVAAGVLASAPAGLRRVMVVLSDGQPNVGLQSAPQLATYVRGLKLAVSSLGFGLHHDENVLEAIATAGSGRYAYIPDPALARVDLARAALAHGGIVADQLELEIKLAEGVELTKLVPVSQLRYGAAVATSLGDVFVDEGRLVAVELRLQLEPSGHGRLAEITVKGKSPDGTPHRATASIAVDVRSGARVVERDAQRDVLMVLADAARADARAHADRGAYPGAAAILREMAARIDRSEGFVLDDGSHLADVREQLEDEAQSYERKSTDAERMHQRKAAYSYKMGTPMGTPMAFRAAAPLAAQLVGIAGPVLGQCHVLALENAVGRVNGNDIVIAQSNISKRHTRILFVDDAFVLQDLGSTGGTYVNGQRVRSHKLVHGDQLTIGDAAFRFEIL